MRPKIGTFLYILSSIFLSTELGHCPLGSDYRVSVRLVKYMLICILLSPVRGVHAPCSFHDFPLAPWSFPFFCRLLLFNLFPCFLFIFPCFFFIFPCSFLIFLLASGFFSCYMLLVSVFLCSLLLCIL